MHYKYIILLFVFMGWLAVFGQPSSNNQSHDFSVGDILYDSTIDDHDFHVCNDKFIMQYHNDGGALAYRGEKAALVETIRRQYVPAGGKEDNGLIRFRFVVNCQGKTGMFRMIGVDENYREKFFSSAITSQLLGICKSLDGWLTKKYYNKETDYYQYLIFKIREGRIIEIMP